MTTNASHANQFAITGGRAAVELLNGAPWITGINIAAKSGVNGDHQHLLLREALAKLADAEERLSEQRERIEYLESLTMTDELTGLTNRRGFNAHFRRVLAQARRTAGQLPAGQQAGEQGGLLVMIDLDGFKAINDTHGHLAGDAYLRRVAQFLMSKVREHDIVARLGGDEFAILLTDTDAGTGEARARELSEAARSEALKWEGHVLPLRFSVGTRPYTALDDEETVLREADVRMYAQKSARRHTRK